MAWSTPMTWSTSFSASQLNTYVRDNLNQTAPAKATVPGQFFVSTGANSIVGRAPQQDVTNAVFNTTSSTYTVLASPSVTINVEAQALFSIYSYVANNTSASIAYASLDVTGSSSAPAQDPIALAVSPGSAVSVVVRASAVFMLPMVAGSITAAMRYRADGGLAIFDHRRIGVVPF